MRSPFTFALIVALLLCGSVFAQTSQPKSALAAAEEAAFKEFRDKIASTDPAVRAAAVEQLREQLKDPGNTVWNLSQYLWALQKAGMNQEVAEFAMQGILTAPGDPTRLEMLHGYRIKALLALKQPDEALAEAKSLFNVCSMKGTGNALQLCADCLQALHPGDKAIIKRFKLQQVAGSTCSPQAGSTSSPQAGATSGEPGRTTQPATQPTGSTSSPQAEPNMLKAIKVNAQPYLDAANSPRWQEEKYGNLMSRGNLLLEADKPAEAKKCFEAAYALASEREQSVAAKSVAESLARVMKAEDGTVGRANAYVMSLRPATQPAQK